MALTEAQLAKMANLKALQTIAERTDARLDDLQGKIDDINDNVIKGVKVNGTALTPTGNAVDILVTMEKLATAENGYASSYQLKANGVPVGDKINIAKDKVIKSANLLAATSENYGTVGCSAAGKKYIDLVVNTVADGDGSAESDTHIYLPVEDLVDVYAAGAGLQLDPGTNTFSIKIDPTGAGGLTAGAGGLKLAEATDNTYTEGVSNNDGKAGAMSVADKHKLDNVSNGANKTEVPNEKAGTILVDGVTKVIVEFATDAEVSERLDAALPAPANS